jgi:oligoendopeptidase F
VEQVEPQAKPRQFNLARLYVGHPLRPQSPRSRYEVFDRDTQAQVELFRPENVPLETEEAKLSQRYQKLIGSLAVTFRGEEQTLTRMGRYLEEPDRAVRQEAWELVAARRLREVDQLEEIFEQLLEIRQRIARNACFDNYRDYAFRRLGRFDYTPEDCLRFHEAVEAEVMPVIHELQAERRRQLGLPTLRPWDLSVDPLNRPPLRPFEQVEQMVSRTQNIFGQLDPELAEGFNRMRQLGLLDLDNRKGKAPGGYQSTLAEARLPFIFMNAVGLQRDVETILHEAGHAFHALAAREENLYAYRSAPIEFCEVASMSMELMAGPYLGEFYADPKDAARSTISHLEDVIILLPWIATIDAFQHWIYTHPGHSRQERAGYWLELRKRLGGMEDWSGLEEIQSTLWHRQLHIFEYPFYYIEYGIAQLGALQGWKNFRKDKSEGVRLYKQGLSAGGTQTLPDIFKSAGIRFDFSLKMIEPLMDEVEKELERLESF